MLPWLTWIAAASLLVIHWAIFLGARLLCGRGASWFRVWLAFAATALLGFLGYRMDGLSGALVLPFLAHAFFWTSVAVVGQWLTPLSKAHGRWGAFHLLSSYMLDCHLPSYLVENGKWSRRVIGHQESHIGTGLIWVGVAQAAVTEVNGRLRRVLPPGIHQVQRFEQVNAVLDLHPQIRSSRRPVRATTLDGVPLHASLECVFRIPTDPSAGSSDDFGFSAERIGEIVFDRGGVDARGEPYYWDDRPLQLAASRFREILGRLRLDQLLEPDDPNPVPHKALANLLDTALRGDLSAGGIDLIGCTVGPLEFDPEVQEQVLQQRIESLQRRWETGEERDAATGPAAEETVKAAAEQARANLAIELIDQLATAIDSSQPALSRQLIHHLLDTMEALAADPLVQPLLSSELTGDVSSIRSWVTDSRDG